MLGSTSPRLAGDSISALSPLEVEQWACVAEVLTQVPVLQEPSLVGAWSVLRSKPGSPKECGKHLATPTRVQ